MADAFLEKATSAVNEAKESVTATAETTTETARSALTDAQKTVEASTETVKTEAEAAPKKASDLSTQVGLGHTLLHVSFFWGPTTNKLDRVMV